MCEPATSAIKPATPRALQPFADLVGQDVVELIFNTSPTKVGTRIGKALDHYTKALKLSGVDDEMGAIRCIAAEEELVVAIFEWLKLNEASVPEHADFIKRYKNHRVKLAFYPVLSQIRFVLGDMLKHGFTFEGLEDALHLTVAPTIVGEKVMLRVRAQEAGPTLDLNPLHVAISRDDLDHDEIVAELFADFQRIVADQNGMTVREFITSRAEYRNHLLYASDGGFATMEESLDTLISGTFAPSYRDLLWTLAVVLGNKPAAKEWGLISQFIGLYRRALSEAKII